MSNNNNKNTKRPEVKIEDAKAVALFIKDFNAKDTIILNTLDAEYALSTKLFGMLSDKKLYDKEMKELNDCIAENRSFLLKRIETMTKIIKGEEELIKRYASIKDDKKDGKILSQEDNTEETTA